MRFGVRRVYEGCGYFRFFLGFIIKFFRRLWLLIESLRIGSLGASLVVGIVGR